MSDTERTHYDRHGVRVTDSRLYVKAQWISLAQIESVTDTMDSSGTGCLLQAVSFLLAIGSSVLILWGVALWTNDYSYNNGIPHDPSPWYERLLTLTGPVLLVTAFWLYRKCRTYRPEYVVQVNRPFGQEMDVRFKKGVDAQDFLAALAQAKGGLSFRRDGGIGWAVGVGIGF